MAGKITVSNPNTWEAITANVTDTVDDGGACVVSGGANVVVPASGSVSLDYTCTYASAPSPLSGRNTGTAAWDSSAAYTPSGSATGSAPFAFGAPTTTVNKSITVTDAFNGGAAGVLGPPLTATDGTPYVTGHYTYSHTVANATTGGSCKAYNNTAVIIQTGQSASQTVNVCNTATGALTMGFWQNKNGQGIITGGASLSGVCKSGTWLRQYAPFQDLSATATCAQVGTYVTNIIKSANASGAAMNAMLKGQMLATALDVYFSDPALGGNKINAAQPLGLVRIDLTKVCKMIDNSSTGSGSCSGITVNASSAFGGATALTVSQLLAYAASQSNAGGSTWYANVAGARQEHVRRDQQSGGADCSVVAEGKRWRGVLAPTGRRSASAAE